MRNIENLSQETINKWQIDPENWVFGVLYFNKKDPRVSVSKPNGQIGFTLNFANPKSYLFLFCAFCFFGFVIFMIERNK